jgi:hypothetical protein
MVIGTPKRGQLEPLHASNVLKARGNCYRCAWSKFHRTRAPDTCSAQQDRYGSPRIGGMAPSLHCKPPPRDLDFTAWSGEGRGLRNR